MYLISIKECKILINIIFYEISSGFIHFVLGCFLSAAQMYLILGKLLCLFYIFVIEYVCTQSTPEARDGTKVPHSDVINKSKDSTTVLPFRSTIEERSLSFERNLTILEENEGMISNIILLKAFLDSRNIKVYSS